MNKFNFAIWTLICFYTQYAKLESANNNIKRENHIEDEIFYQYSYEDQVETDDKEDIESLDVTANSIDKLELNALKKDLNEDYNIEILDTFNGSILKSIDKYCKLYLNGMVIHSNINEETYGNGTNLRLKIDAYFGDDLHFECDIPKKYLSSKSIHWKLNGTRIELYDNFFNLVVDKKIAIKQTSLDVTCSFTLINHNQATTVEFPIIILGKDTFRLLYLNKVHVNKNIQIIEILVFILPILVWINLVMKCNFFKKNFLRYKVFVLNIFC